MTGRLRRPDLAATLVAATVAVALAGDLWLHRHHRRLVTDVLRTPTGIACQLYLAAHVADVLGPLDLFKHAAHLTRSRTT